LDETERDTDSESRQKSDERIAGAKFYEPGNEVGIMYNDKDLNIDWKLATSELTFSEKDKTLGSFADYAASL
jgi:dTDP-4-dehydrorhamnose 3,5-epimerase-like enzyme